MVKVCVHHPLNPEKSRKCIDRKIHDDDDISELDVPFSGDLLKFGYALASLRSARVISVNDARSVYEEVKRRQEEIVNKLNQAPWIIPTPSEWAPLNPNDPRISEIYIKYRD